MLKNINTDKIYKLSIYKIKFIELTSQNQNILKNILLKLGFKPIAKHLKKNIILFSQNNINFILNFEKNSFSKKYSKEYGTNICSIYIKVNNPNNTYNKLIKFGAWKIYNKKIKNKISIKMIHGISNSKIYFINNDLEKNNLNKDIFFYINFYPIKPYLSKKNNILYNKLFKVSNLIQIVNSNNIKEWYRLYKKISNFKEIYKSHKKLYINNNYKNKINIIKSNITLLNEKKIYNLISNKKYLSTYIKEGMQLITLTTKNIFKYIDKLLSYNIKLLNIPLYYYEKKYIIIIKYGLDIKQLKKKQIFINIKKTNNNLLLLFHSFIYLNKKTNIIKIIQYNKYFYKF